MKKDRKNMTIVRYGNSQPAPEVTFVLLAIKTTHLDIGYIAGGIITHLDIY